MKRIIRVLSCIGFLSLYCPHVEEENEGGNLQLTSHEHQTAQKREQEENQEKQNHANMHKEGLGNQFHVQHTDGSVDNNSLKGNAPVVSQAKLEELGITHVDLKEDGFTLPDTGTVKEAMREKGYTETFLEGIAKTPEAKLDLLDLVVFDIPFRNAAKIDSTTLGRLREELKGNYQRKPEDGMIVVSREWMIRNAKKEIAALYKTYLKMDKKLDRKINRYARLLSAKLEQFATRVESSPTEGILPYNKIIMTRDDLGKISIVDANAEGKEALDGFGLEGEEALIAQQIFFKEVPGDKILLNPSTLKQYLMKINSK